MRLWTCTLVKLIDPLMFVFRGYYNLTLRGLFKNIYNITTYFIIIQYLHGFFSYFLVINFWKRN